MKLALLVRTQKYLRHVLGITDEALGRGHEVDIFVMDEGVKHLTDATLAGLSEKDRVNVSFCNMNATQHAIKTEELTGYIKKGSQYDNCLMMQNADKVLVL